MRRPRTRGRRAGHHLAAILFAGLAPGAVADDQPTVYSGATLFDGTGRPPIENAYVVVGDGRILAVGDADMVPSPDGAAHVDISGKWLIPGLIDAHVHLFQSGGLYTRPDVVDLRHVLPYEQEMAAIRVTLDATLARTFAAGITGVVDFGGPDWLYALRERAEHNAVSPRIALAGQLIATWSPRQLAIDPAPIKLVATPSEAREAIRRQAERKPDLIKIWFVRARGDQDFETAQAWVSAAIDEAHKLGLRAAVHATEHETAVAALAAGADVLVHSVDDQMVTDAFLLAMHERNAIYIPTLGVYDGYWRVLRQYLRLTENERRLGDPRVIESLDDLSTLPESDVPSWLTIGRPPPPVNPIMLNNLVRVHDANLVIAAGSDAGNIGTLHGAGFHRELAYMADAGMAPADILVTATMGGAKVMGRADEIGSIEPGKRADFVVLDADPLADIRNASRVSLVVKDGTARDPDEVLAGLALQE